MKHWFVIYVRPRNEKRVSLQLEKLGIEVYCPLVTEIRQWSDRKKKVELPLFNSYVFVKVYEKERDIVFQVPGVIRYIFWLGKPAIVREEEILVLKKWLSGELLETRIEGIEVGELVEIKAGPFKGSKGFVKEINKNRIQLMLLDLGIKVTITKTNF